MIRRKTTIAFVSFMLSIILLLWQIPVFAAEADSGRCGPYLTWSYEESSGTLTISGEGPMYDYFNFSDATGCAPFSAYRGKVKFIVIEEGCTYIGAYAFSGFIHVVDIVFPENSLKEIGPYAFNYCIELTRVFIPDCVEKLGEYAFTTCQDLKMIDFGEGIREIPKGICNRAGELETVFLPEICTSVGNAAFFECKKLKSIDLSKVEVIGANAFNTCSVLKNVTFGENIDSIGENSFYACSAITEFEFLGTPRFISSGFAYGTAWYKSLSDGPFVLCGEILLCKGTYTETTLIVPDGIKTISESAFTNNSTITTVILPEGLERICNFALFKLEKLTSIEIPQSVNFIGERAIGYKAASSSQSEINPNYVIYGKGGTAWEYAANLGFNYVCLHEYEAGLFLEDCTVGGVSFEECKFCGIRTNEAVIAPVSSHELEVVEISPTCENDGVKHTSCKNCSVSFEEENGKATGHTAGIWQVIEDSTCFEYGIIGKPCKSCGVLLEEKQIQKKEHTAANTLRVINEKTCTEDGIYETYCSLCDETMYTVTEKATGHAAAEDFTTVKEALDGVPGYEVKFCTSCGIIIEGRWFTLEDLQRSIIEKREARAVCSLLMSEVMAGCTSEVREASLDFNCDGELDMKDSVLLKQLSE